VRHWAALALGMVAGSLTSMVSAWALATLLGVDEQLRLSLLARSLSTPFAMEVSNTIGGAADLTALFVIATGLVGATLGELMLACLPIRSALARGALLGLGAHGMGTAKAHEVGGEEGTIAGLTMVLTGLLNVLAAPLIGAYARLL
ncbi:MAG: LrgB family protein, partial [Alphaproteobacteria bacterium]|nr:LrgB family protein [Alphaproteobacteria bacterium]